MDLENSKWWNDKKEELLDGIRQTKELGSVDSDILELMEELLDKTKVQSSITDFYKNIKD